MCKSPPVAALRCRRPAHPLVPVSMGCWVASCWRGKAFAIHLQEGIHSAACTYAVRSTDGGCVALQHQSAATGGGRRTRLRGGFSNSQMSRRNEIKIAAKKLESDPNYLFAAPMAGASTDNIGAQRLAEGGVPASGASSAQSRLAHPKNWTLTPITAVAANARCAPPAGGGWRRVCSGRQ